MVTLAETSCEYTHIYKSANNPISRTDNEVPLQNRLTYHSVHSSLNYEVISQHLDYTPGLNLSVKKGELIAVVGPVACGKTTLLMSILRELEHEGNLLVNGKLAFSSQVPWIFNGKVISVIFLLRFRVPLRICV